MGSRLRRRGGSWLGGADERGGDGAAVGDFDGEAVDVVGVLWGLLRGGRWGAGEGDRGGEAIVAEGSLVRSAAMRGMKAERMVR